MWAHQDTIIVHLVIDGEMIETTPEHPFYVGEGEWVAAGELVVGDEINRANGETGVVETIRFIIDPQPMYNFTVDVAHTYFVGDGEWLVHNDCIDEYLGNLLEGANPGRKTRGRTTQYEQTGGQQEALIKFSSMNFETSNYYSNGTRVGYLADGTTVTFYPVSSGGVATIKIQRKNDFRRIAIRYYD